MKQTKKIFSRILILLMVISLIAPGNAVAVKAAETDYQAKLTAVTKCLHDNVKPVYTAEWALLQQARQDNPDKKWLHDYYNALVDQLKDEEKISEMQPSDWARVILAVEALGGDPADFNGRNLFDNLADFSKIDTSAWGMATMSIIMMAVGSREDSVFDKADVPAEKRTTKEKLKNAVLALYNTEEKCFNTSDYYTGDAVPDSDNSAYAIQALAGYYKTDSDIKTKIDDTLATLGDKFVDENACVTSFGYANACSTAQVICALTSVGIDPASDARFTKDGKTLIDGLCSYFDDATGGIKGYDGEIDYAFNTVQAAYALVAYDRLKNDQTFVFDSSDVTEPIYHYTEKTELVNVKEATCTEAGYTGDKVCDDCGEIFEKGKEIPAKGHTPVEIPAVAATETTAGKTAGKKCSVCGAIIEEPKDVPALGTLNDDYKVTSSDTSNPTVEYNGSADKTSAAIEIPATVKDANGVEYKVTKIADGAFKGNTTVTTVTIGENVTEIGKNAFLGCTSLKTLKIDSNKITKIGESAFKGDKALKSVDLSKSKIKTIGKNAFSGCKKLSKIKINGDKVKTVGKNAFKNVKKNAKIIIKAKNKKTYNKVVKLIEKSGAKNVKIASK